MTLVFFDIMILRLKGHSKSFTHFFLDHSCSTQPVKTLIKDLDEVSAPKRITVVMS